MSTQCNALFILFIVVAVLEALFFSVMTAGWGLYIYVLIKNGFYSYLCEGDSVSNVTANASSVTEFATCREQQEELNLMYTIAVTAQKVLCVGWGMIVYRFGTVKPKMLSMLLFIAGCLMLGFASPQSLVIHDWGTIYHSRGEYTIHYTAGMVLIMKGNPMLILPGLVLIGISGLAIIIFNMKITAYLKFGQGIYVALLTGAADSSVITFRIVKLLNDNGVELLIAFLGIILLHILLSGSSTILHKMFDQRQQDKLEAMETVTEINLEGTQNGDILQESDVKTGMLVHSEVGDIRELRPLKQSVCCCVNYTLLLWYSINMTGIYMYYGTINKRLADSFPDKVSELTNIMAYMLCGGLLSSFVPGSVIEWQNKICKGIENKEERAMSQNIIPLAITSLLHIILNILSFITSEVVLYIEFGVLTLLRSFIFSSSVTFVVTVFPIKHSSVLFALCETVGGIIALSQYGFFRWYNLSSSSKNYVRSVITCLSILTLLHPIMVFLTRKGRNSFNILCLSNQENSKHHTNNFKNKNNKHITLNNKEPLLDEVT